MKNFLLNIMLNSKENIYGSEFMPPLQGSIGFSHTLSPGLRLGLTYPAPSALGKSTMQCLEKKKKKM